MVQCELKNNNTLISLRGVGRLERYGIRGKKI